MEYGSLPLCRIAEPWVSHLTFANRQPLYSAEEPQRRDDDHGRAMPAVTRRPGQARDRVTSSPVASVLASRATSTTANRERRRAGVSRAISRQRITATRGETLVRARRGIPTAALTRDQDAQQRPIPQAHHHPRVDPVEKGPRLPPAK